MCFYFHYPVPRNGTDTVRLEMDMTEGTIFPETDKTDSNIKPNRERIFFNQRHFS